MNQALLRIGDEVKLTDWRGTFKARVIKLGLSSGNGRKDSLQVELIDRDNEKRTVTARSIDMFWHQWEVQLDKQKLMHEYHSTNAERQEKRKELNKALLATLIPEAKGARNGYINFDTEDKLYEFLNRLNELTENIPFAFPTELGDLRFEAWKQAMLEAKIKANFPNTKELTN